MNSFPLSPCYPPTVAHRPGRASEPASPVRPRRRGQHCCDRGGNRELCSFGSAHAGRVHLLLQYPHPRRLS
eukprot:6837103-Prymnesium_polylepis.1